MMVRAMWALSFNVEVRRNVSSVQQIDKKKHDNYSNNKDKKKPRWTCPSFLGDIVTNITLNSMLEGKTLHIYKYRKPWFK